ncbi:MAG: DNA-processing protein DprA [Parcubacteria group bacterium]
MHSQDVQPEESRAWLAWSWCGLGPASFALLENTYGSLAKAWEQRLKALQKVRLTRDKIGDVRARLMAFDSVTVVKELKRLRLTPICRFEPIYPSVLRQLSDPPPVLYVRGNSEILARPAVAIVGSRNASEYGKQQTSRFAGQLSRAGVVVVSGLAYGVDAHAHEATLGAAPSIAVVAGGLGIRLMSWQVALADKLIANGGAMVSEFPPDIPPLKYHFPLRNRIIAALAKITLVTEARGTSGALITALRALELGHSVMAVPSDLGRASAEGSNRLLRDGAGVALSPQEVLEELARQLPQDQATRLLRGSSGAGSPLLQLLKKPRTLEQLVAALGIRQGPLMLQLTELELDGKIGRTIDGLFVAITKP